LAADPQSVAIVWRTREKAIPWRIPASPCAPVRSGSPATAIPAQGLRARTFHFARHPKAALYADFPDFSAFFSMVPVSASLNGGFGKAFVLEGSEDLTMHVASQSRMSPALEAKRDFEHMNDRSCGRLPLMHMRGLHAKSRITGWKVCGIDCAGLDLLNRRRPCPHRVSMPRCTKAASGFAKSWRTCPVLAYSEIQGYT
jgi:hypothetical protein